MAVNPARNHRRASAAAEEFPPSNLPTSLLWRDCGQRRNIATCALFFTTEDPSASAAVNRGC